MRNDQSLTTGLKGTNDRKPFINNCVGARNPSDVIDRGCRVPLEQSPADLALMGVLRKRPSPTAKSAWSPRLESFRAETNPGNRRMKRTQVIDALLPRAGGEINRCNSIRIADAVSASLTSSISNSDPVHERFRPLRLGSLLGRTLLHRGAA